MALSAIRVVRWLTGRAEPLAIPAGQLDRVVRQRRLDDGAAFVLRRAKDLLDEHVGDPVGIVPRIDDEEVHRPDVPARPDRRPEGEERRPDDFSSRLRDEHARLRKVDQLSQEVRSHERAATIRRRGRRRAKRDQPIDVGDPCRPNQVVHADGCFLARMAQSLRAS